MVEAIKNKLGEKTALAVIVIALAVAVAGGGLFIAKHGSDKSAPSIISKATLEKIINVSDLSTFEAVYNGIAKVMNEENTEQVDYYVSYEAKVKAGIDFEDVDIVIEDDKVIVVRLPETKIVDITVDITSFDYIFENDKANTATVSEQAYKHCIEDVTNESNQENAIYELAEQNARNIVEALITPFIQQLDADYQLRIEQGGV